MRLIYFHMYGGYPSDGVNKKIFSQASYLFKLGINLELVLVGGINNKYPLEPYIKHLGSPFNKYFQRCKIIKIFRQYLARKYIIEILKNSPPDSILYIRYPLPLF